MGRSGRERPESLRRALALALLVLGELLALASAARSTPRSRRRKKERSGEYLPGQFLVVLKYLVLFVFGPAILFFIYSVVRDPVTPHLAWELLMRCRERLSGNLGDDNAKRRVRSQPASRSRWRSRRD